MQYDEKLVPEEKAAKWASSVRINPTFNRFVEESGQIHVS